MDALSPGTLLALSSDVLPELREQRDQYDRFWYVIGGVAILAWLLVYVVFRTRPLVGRPLLTAVVAAAVMASGLGWAVWFALSPSSWGDYGTGSRWAAELAACVLGSFGWCLAVGCLVLSRERPQSPPPERSLEASGRTSRRDSREETP